MNTVAKLPSSSSPPPPSNTNSNKMLNPEAEEWRPAAPLAKTAPPPPPPYSQMIVPFPSVQFVFYPFQYRYPQPEKSFLRPCATLLEITDSPAEKKKVDQDEKGLFLVNQEGQMVKRRRSPSFSRARKVGRGRILCRGPPRRVGSSFDRAAELSPKQSWKPKGPKPGRSLQSSPVNVTGNTTVMIKNVPNSLRRNDMLKFLDHHCFKYSSEYDFLYLPMDFRTQDNLGYAFVNFTTAESAWKIMNVLEGFKWRTGGSDLCAAANSQKQCQMTWARIQGKDALLHRFNGSSFCCDRADFLPVLLRPPRDGTDPNPPRPVVIGSLRFRPKH